jgi:hypothetical protein
MIDRFIWRRIVPGIVIVVLVAVALVYWLR